MSRLKLALPGLLGIILTGTLVAWALRDRGAQPRPPSALVLLLTAPQVEIPKLVQEAELRIRGGVGIFVSHDQNGLLKIESVAVGSPAAAAGLKGGELIANVDGKPLLGMPLTNAANWIRGFNGTQVELTVQKPGSTNWESVLLKRVSMKKAIELNSRSAYE